MQRITRVLIGTVSLLGIALTGCAPRNPETAAVEGVVTLDGKPVDGAAVVFTPPEGRQATATTDSTGRFVLSTFKKGDGALLGPHQVTVSKTEVRGDELGEDGELIFVVPRKYGNPATSPLTCEVQPEMDAVRLELRAEERQEPPPAAEAQPVLPGGETETAPSDGNHGKL